MKQRYIQYLIVVSTLAIIGLIAIQVYWVNNTFMLRQQDFGSAVTTVLNHVCEQMEKEEMIRISEATATAPAISLTNGADSTLIVNYRGSRVGVSNSYTDKELIKGDTLLEVQNEILNQSGILDDVMQGLFELDIYKGIADRVDTRVLDSLIKEGLEKRNIKAEYVYGIFSRLKTPELLPNAAEPYKEQLANEGYKAQLFPNDPYSDTNYLRIFFPEQNRYLLGSMWKMLVTAATLLLVIMFLFSYSIRIIYRQKKLSEIKSDFINNMTHELKTPIATISLACEALNDPDMRTSEKAMANYLAMIKEENKRLGMLVENVLRTSVFESGQMKMNWQKIDLHETINQVITNIEIQVLRNKGTIKKHLDAGKPIIEGDQLHITNLIYNLIDNAVKYCEGAPIIEIYTRDEMQGIALQFKDNGIGISKENQKKIFDKLYRVPTGNVHNVKGFGLGLSYVKGIVERHGGTVEVSSESRKGSTFTIHLPYTQNHEKEN